MSRPRNDYSYLIGQKIGDREILNVIRKKARGYNAPYAICKCKCGKVEEVIIPNLMSDRSQKCIYCSRADKIEPRSNNKLGVKYVYFDNTTQRYAVDIKRNGKRKRGSASTLTKAKILKVRLLKEFENEMKAHD